MGNTFIIEIRPKKPTFDPLASHVRQSLLDYGESSAQAAVQTARLYKLVGDFSEKEIKVIAETLLVDPVVETFHIQKESKTKAAPKKKGIELTVWPKRGVTDPVAETVKKGLSDLGYKKKVETSFAQRYTFPKIKNQTVIQKLAKQTLANQLIHDIDIRKAS